MTDIVKRLREGTTDGTTLRWQVTDIHREAADEIERLRAASQWKPIETAPKDGTVVMLAMHEFGDATEPFTYIVGRYHNGVWYEDDDDSDGMMSGSPLVPPTHWQPLPSPPTQEGGG